MSDKVKEALKNFAKETNISPVQRASNVADEYARSANAKAEDIPKLIKHVTHLYVTGELLPWDDK